MDRYPTRLSLVRNGSYPMSPKEGDMGTRIPPVRNGSIPRLRIETWGTRIFHTVWFFLKVFIEFELTVDPGECVVSHVSKRRDMGHPDSSEGLVFCESLQRI